MKTLERIKEIEELYAQMPNGSIEDADNILIDLLEQVDFRFPGIAIDVFEIYKRSQDKEAVKQMFYEFTQVEFDDFLERCIPADNVINYPREVLEAYLITTKLKLSKEDLLMEAELVENEGEWLHLSLMGYDSSVLKKVAEMM